MDLIVILGIMGLAFCAEFVDSSLGMGYGTTLTPLLLAIGFLPMQAVPAILVSELFTGFFAAILFSKLRIVNFDFKRDDESAIVKRLGKLGYMPKSMDSKIAFVLTLCSLVGTVIAVFIAVNLPKFYLELIIGLIILIMGIIILIKRNSEPKFSWGKIVGLGGIAAFNKGLSGGGYGPLVTAGQILSGIKSKNSVAISSFAEAFTCVVGVICYFVMGKSIDWSLAPFLVIGAMCSVPFAAYAVNKFNTNKFTAIVGAATLVLGVYTLYNLFM